MSEITTSEGEKEEVCAFCKCFTKEKCSACKSVYYCSREHERSDLENHSKNCQIFMLAENSTLGRHYIATRDIEMDEIILTENKPLLVSPPSNTLPVCLSCYVRLTYENAQPCGNCGWPLCLDCTRHGPECQLTIKYVGSKVGIYGFTGRNMLYDSICVLRALDLREKSPDDYKKLMNLESHYTEIMNESLGCLKSGMLLRTAQHSKLHLKINDLDEHDIAKIIGICAINGFITVSAKGHRYAAVFDKASYHAHDCHPNCGWNCRYDANSGANMRVRALRMIPKGESLTITYVNPLLDTKNRRKMLRNSKFFDCTCKRCEDPTEFGTMFSAVKCFRKDCTGYMLPSTFLVSKDTPIPDFACNKCELTTLSTTIDAIADEGKAHLSKIELKNEDELKKFIENQSKIFHNNHYNIVEAQMMTAGECEDNLQNLHRLPEKYLKEHITLCKKVSDLLEILAPMQFNQRGKIRIWECSYMLALMPTEYSRSLENGLILYEDCKKAFIEACRLLRDEEIQDPMDQLKTVQSDLKTWSEYF